MNKEEQKEIMKKLYKDLTEYFDSCSEYGIGYVDGIYDVCAKLGIGCSKVDEGKLEFTNV